MISLPHNGYLFCRSSINEDNVRISLSNIYIHKANAGNFEPKKEVKSIKSQIFLANDNKIIKLTFEKKSVCSNSATGVGKNLPSSLARSKSFNGGTSVFGDW